MAPSSISRTLCAARLAVTMMLAVWLTAMPARCDPAPSIARLAAATLISPTWSWLQLLLWSTLPSGPGSPPAPHAASARRPSTVRWHGIGSAGSTASDTGGGSGDGSGGTACGSDPNGCKPGT